MEETSHWTGRSARTYFSGMDEEGISLQLSVYSERISSVIWDSRLLWRLSLRRNLSEEAPWSSLKLKPAREGVPGRKSTFSLLSAFSATLLVCLAKSGPRCSEPAVSPLPASIVILLRGLLFGIFVGELFTDVDRSGEGAREGGFGKDSARIILTLTAGVLDGDDACFAGLTEGYSEYFSEDSPGLLNEIEPCRFEILFLGVRGRCCAIPSGTGGNSVHGAGPGDLGILDVVFDLFFGVPGRDMETAFASAIDAVEAMEIDLLC